MLRSPKIMKVRSWKRSPGSMRIGTPTRTSCHPSLLVVHLDWNPWGDGTHLFGDSLPNSCFGVTGHQEKTQFVSGGLPDEEETSLGDHHTTELCMLLENWQRSQANCTKFSASPTDHWQLQDVRAPLQHDIEHTEHAAMIG